MHAYNLCIHRLVIIATLMFTIIFHYMSVTELLTLSACARVTVVVCVCVCECENGPGDKASCMHGICAVIHCSLQRLAMLQQIVQYN